MPYASCDDAELSLDCGLCLSGAIESSLNCGWCMNIERCVDVDSPKDDCNKDVIMPPSIGAEACWLGVRDFGIISCGSRTNCQECLGNKHCAWCDSSPNRRGINQLLEQYFRLLEDGVDPYYYWVYEGHIKMSIVFQDTLKQLEKLQMFSLLGWELNRQPISEGVSVGYCFPADFTNTTCEYDGVASWSVDLSQCPKTFVTPITPEFFQAADATTSGYFTVCMVVVVGPFFVALLILGVARSFKSF